MSYRVLSATVGLLVVWGIICACLAAVYGRGTTADIFGFTWLAMHGLAGSLAVIGWSLRWWENE